MISYHDRWYKIFVIVKTLVLILQSQLYTYIAAFRFNWTHNSTTYYIADAIELFILFDICTKFIREYTPPGQTTPVRDWKLCAKDYAKTLMLADLIYILPLQKIPMINNRQDLFFLIKQPRCLRLFLIADVRSIAHAFGEFSYNFRNWLYNRKKEQVRDFKFQYNILETNAYQKFIRDQVFDNFSKNDFELLWGYIVRLIKNVMIVFEACYQVCLLFLIVCVGIEEWQDQINYTTADLTKFESPRFLIEYNLYEMD